MIKMMLWSRRLRYTFLTFLLFLLVHITLAVTAVRAVVGVVMTVTGARGQDARFTVFLLLRPVLVAVGGHGGDGMVMYATETAGSVTA